MADLKLLEDPKTQEALERGLRVLTRLEETGMLAFLEGASEVLADSVSYLTDPRLLKIFSNIAYFLHILETLEPTILTVMVNHFAEEMNKEFTPELMKKPPQMGPMAFFKALSDPDVQKGLGFLFLFLKVLGRAFDRSGKQLLGLMEETEKALTKLREERKQIEAQIARPKAQEQG